MKILLFTPPLLQPNTPYAATPLLTAWLRSLGHETVQADLSLELLLRLFSKKGLRALADGLGLEKGIIDPYVATIDEVMTFLQDRNPAAARRIAARGWLPEGDHLAQAYALEEQLGWSFRGMDVSGRARYFASLYLDDIADAAASLDPHFGFSRYAEKLAVSLPSFEPIQKALATGGSLFIHWLEELTDLYMGRYNPEMVALTVPFPGCLLGALVIARRVKLQSANVHVTLGGGYVNTELRALSDPGIFKFVDTITLDSGFRPLQMLAAGGNRSTWIRTHALDGASVRLYDAGVAEVRQNELPAPTYDGLPLDRYFAMTEVLNPASCLWSESRWNKLVLAHGCCWSRCAFCDTSLDYICRYDPAHPERICDWIEEVMRRTNFNGFHFVDEALPPRLVDQLCDQILERGLRIEWWGNVRFETRFDRALIRKMAHAGCIAVTGGLETCCDRTLRLMQKGISVEHAARVLGDFSDAGILTHAYLMYGFPTQTRAEILDALETVRHLFEAGCLHSAYWHRFALTEHSKMAEEPERFGITIEDLQNSGFARNEMPFSCPFDYDPELIGRGLKAAVYNFQLGIGFELPVQTWIDP